MSRTRHDGNGYCEWHSQAGAPACVLDERQYTTPVEGCQRRNGAAVDSPEYLIGDPWGFVVYWLPGDEGYHDSQTEHESWKRSECREPRKRAKLRQLYPTSQGRGQTQVVMGPVLALAHQMVSRLEGLPGVLGPAGYLAARKDTSEHVPLRTGLSSKSRLGCSRPSLL